MTTVELAGQLVTLAAQLVMVYSVVLYTVIVFTVAVVLVEGPEVTGETAYVLRLAVAERVTVDKMEVVTVETVV